MGEFNKIKFEERIRNEANLWLREGASDPRLTLLTITKVELNKDYSVAKIFWDSFSMDNKESSQEALSKSVGRLRSFLAKNLNVRHTPSLSFVYDSQYEDEKKIEDLLRKSSEN